MQSNSTLCMHDTVFSVDSLKLAMNAGHFVSLGCLCRMLQNGWYRGWAKYGNVKIVAVYEHWSYF